MPQGLKIGSLLDHGKYRIEKVLGQGGFGITSLVTDLVLIKLENMKVSCELDLCKKGIKVKKENE